MFDCKCVLKISAWLPHQNERVKNYNALSEIYVGTWSSYMLIEPYTTNNLTVSIFPCTKCNLVWFFGETEKLNPFLTIKTKYGKRTIWIGEKRTQNNVVSCSFCFSSCIFMTTRHRRTFSIFYFPFILKVKLRNSSVSCGGGVGDDVAVYISPETLPKK